ncbi:MAG: translation initiation factor [Sandaracinaceae bacterium]|nr:translation initiation factor [Sandaracinaceae bacterium]
MSTKKKRTEAPPKELTQSPFAALAGALAEAPPGPAPPSPAPRAAEPARFEPRVVVRREKKGRGGKTITRISGVAAPARADVAAALKRALGCGATIEDDDVVLLGALVDRAADWLEAEGARRVVRAN